MSRQHSPHTSRSSCWVNAHPVPESSVAWHCAHGRWMVSVFVSVLWEVGVGQLVGQVPSHNTLYYAAAAFALHVSE